jgi:hypothetical protein
MELVVVLDVLVVIVIAIVFAMIVVDLHAADSFFHSHPAHCIPTSQSQPK